MGGHSPITNHHYFPNNGQTVSGSEDGRKEWRVRGVKLKTMHRRGVGGKVISSPSPPRPGPLRPTIQQCSPSGPRDHITEKETPWVFSFVGYFNLFRWMTLEIVSSNPTLALVDSCLRREKPPFSAPECNVTIDPLCPS